MNIRECPKCKKEPPSFDENGKHNFCPSSEFEKGKIVEICMKCKMAEVIEKWEKDKS